jgi:glycosyltransferase involved in cell wall biosynthesis
LVIKVSGAELFPEAYEQFQQLISGLEGQIVVLTEMMSDKGIKNLVDCCDCFVSLHRSEGFGRGAAEAMSLGKPVIATAYSGVLDFCNAETCALVEYQLVGVGLGEYPHGEGQVWAEANIEQAAHFMTRFLLDPDHGRQLGARARISVRNQLGYLSIGQLNLQKLNEL